MKLSRTMLPAVALFAGFGFAIACSSSSSNELVAATDSGSDTSAEQVDASDAGTPSTDAAVCTSGKTWKSGTEGSELMQPGNACIACHATTGGDAPTFYVAGTVFPTIHEPSLCDGKTGINVVITDSKNNVFSLTTNSAGNFACGPVARGGFPACASFTAPFNAKVVTDAGTNEMTASQTTGDCNSCHTEYGANSAPGRIHLP